MTTRMFRRAAALWLGAIAAVGLVAVISRATLDQAAGQLLDLTFPSRATAADLAVVLAHNGALAGALLIAAPRRSFAVSACITASVSLNVAMAGIAVGAYGGRLISHASVYGLTELAGFCVAASSYIEGRRAAPTVLVSGVLVLLGAVFETIAPVRLD